jgi:hypothetical protein
VRGGPDATSNPKIYRGGLRAFLLCTGEKKRGDQGKEQWKDKVFGRNLSEHLGKSLVTVNIDIIGHKAQGARHK